MASKCQNIPEELRDLHRWVCADNDSKRPMSPFSNYAASVSNPKTWGSFEEASSAVEEGKRDWLGFVFDDDGYVGIDIDCGFDEDGLPTEDALNVIRACASYTEISKSGRGFHIICKADLSFNGKATADGWEIYKSGRFFVITGRVLKGFEEVNEAQEAVDALVEDKFKDTALESKGRRSSVIWKPIWSLPEDGRVFLDPEWERVCAGTRHLSLVSFCGTWHNAGCSEAHLMQMALAANERYMSPPLPQSEVEQVVHSCAKYRRD